MTKKLESSAKDVVLFVLGILITLVELIFVSVGGRQHQSLFCLAFKPKNLILRFYMLFWVKYSHISTSMSHASL